MLAGPLDPQSRAALEERRAALAALVAPGPDGRQRQLLAFSPVGDGMAVEVFGDLTTADHVALLVPGMGSKLDNFPGLAANAYDLQRNAQLNHAAPGQQVATIADDLRPQGGELYAMHTDDELIRWVDGHGGDPTNADFGAVVLAANHSEPDSGYETIAGHSAYYTPNSLSLDNLAIVTVDQPHLLIAQTEPLGNPISAGPFFELPTTMSDSFADALDNARDGFTGTRETTVPPPP